MAKRHINIPIFIPHLGCPFDCIFCNQKKIASTIVAPAPTTIGNIIDGYLATVTNACRIEVAFFGGSFTAIREDLQEEYLEAVQPYINRGQVEAIRISTRPDFITPRILSRLQKYKVKTIELGVQSLDDEVLKKSCRGYTVDDVFKASYLIKEHGFELGIQLMVGLPGDTHEIDIATTKLAISLAPDMVRIYPTLIIQDTVLADMYALGKYQPLKLEEAVTITKEMYRLFSAHDIKVIRMGLYPSAELLSGEAVIAGPFHPAFGELVEQQIFYDQLIYLLTWVNKEINLANSLIICVNPKDISKMIGNHRHNISKLKATLPFEEVFVKGTNLLELNSIGLSLNNDKPQHILTRTEYLHTLMQIS